MKTVILGAGTLGSILAAHLARAGADVTLVARGKRAEYLREQGITVTGLADISASCPIVTTPAEISATDVLIVAVKTYDTEVALASLSHVDVGSIISVQNGVMKNEQIAKVFGTERTLGSTALFSGTMTAEGPVQYGHRHRDYHSDHTYIPPSLWRDHPDEETRGFYGVLNNLSREYLERTAGRDEIPLDETMEILDDIPATKP